MRYKKLFITIFLASSLFISSGLLVSAKEVSNDIKHQTFSKNFATYEVDDSTIMSRSSNSEDLPGGYWQGGMFFYQYTDWVYSKAYSHSNYVLAMVRPGKNANYVTDGFRKGSLCSVQEWAHPAGGNRSGYDYY